MVSHPTPLIGKAFSFSAGIASDDNPNPQTKLTLARPPPKPISGTRRKMPHKGLRALVQPLVPDLRAAAGDQACDDANYLVRVI